MLYKRVKGWTSGGVSQYKTLLIPPPTAPPGLESHLSMFVEGKAPCFVGSISEALFGTSEGLFPEQRLVFEPTCFETDWKARTAL